GGADDHLAERAERQDGHADVRLRGAPLERLPPMGREEVEVEIDQRIGGRGQAWKFRRWRQRLEPLQPVLARGRALAPGGDVVAEGERERRQLRVGSLDEAE